MELENDVSFVPQMNNCNTQTYTVQQYTFIVPV